MIALLLLAQPLYPDVPSLDWLASKAEIVVRARVAEFTAEPDRFALKLDVEETLKGKHETPRRVDIPFDPEALQRWKKDKIEILLFLPARAVVELGRPEVFTADYALLRDRDEILRKTKEALGRTSTQSHKMQLPAELVRGTHWFTYYEGAGAIQLVVPVDERLEKKALEWIKPGAGKDVRHELMLRERAVQALAYFKSEPNIKALRGLLDDPDIGDEARQVLKAWSIKP